MKKLLVLFAKEFPYGVSEPFLELEYPLYKEYFDKALIVTNKPQSGTLRARQDRTVDDPAVEIVASEFDRDLLTRLRFAWAVLTDANFYREALVIWKRRGNRMAMLRSLISCIGKANLCVHAARRRIAGLEGEGYCLTAVYAYWLLYPAYAAVRLNRRYYGGRLFTVSRAHRFDLYENRNPNGYLPCRRYILRGLSRIAAISEDGRRYLERTYPQIPVDIVLHRLGARDVGGMLEVGKDSGPLRIVSCARAVPVKRIERILEALMEIRTFDVEWTHLGGGELLEQLRAQAGALPPNVRCVFPGTVSNTDVYRYYAAHHYHVFVSTSQSEGVPVSIMEAMSFGTPVIATDVGGVGEMIDHGVNGYLLKESFETAELVEALHALHAMDASAYCAMRRAARDMYERSFNAQTNYRAFLAWLSAQRPAAPGK